jgi:MFS family permease
MAAPAVPGVKWSIVLAVVLTAVLEVLDSTIVNVALPHMKAAFGVTSDQTIWILTSYIVASVVVMRPCSNNAVARLATMSRSCAGPPPRRGPLVGVGMTSPA